MNILQPPCDIQLITTRLDCIQELKENTEILYGLMVCHARNEENEQDNS